MSLVSPLGAAPPHIVTDIPGPRSRAAIDVLAARECPAVTARRARRASMLGLADDDPFVWREAVGANVMDVDGNRFVDLTAGFAVSLAGHRHPDIVAAARDQAESLLHAMGDAWSDITRIQLLDRLAAIAPGDLEVSILGLSGSDAVDAAVKTAKLATGRDGVLAFDGGYHGLALGVVGLQGYKSSFTEPFSHITHPKTRHAPFGGSLAIAEEHLSSGDIGLVLVEPIQGRGGVRPAPSGWLADLVALAHRHGAVVAFDEIQCGLGRTGETWACLHDEAMPDLLCTGKALGGGFPISACIGSRSVMDAWGASKGEALHTQTFLGHPVGCATALAMLDLVDAGLPEQCRKTGAYLEDRISALGLGIRGRGLMRGIELGADSLRTARMLQRHGYIVLPAGQQAEVLCLTPPASITTHQIDGFIDALQSCLAEQRR